jgi:hypothetical protein
MPRVERRVDLTMIRSLTLIAALGGGLSLPACEPLAAPAEVGLTSGTSAIGEHDFDLDVCRKRLAAARDTPAMPGAPGYDDNRAAVLGRAYGEPMVFASEPPPFPTPRNGAHPNAWVQRLMRRHRLDKATLRQHVLRDGYVFSEDGREAFALVRELTLPELFDEPNIVLQRGDRTHKLERKGGPRASKASYRYSEGPWQGEAAKVLFGDRVAVDGFGSPRHRDVKSLRNRVGFSRITIERHTEEAIVAKLRFPPHGQAGSDQDTRWVTALVDADGPRLELACLDATRDRRDRIAKALEADAPRRKAVATLQHAVRSLSVEKLPFDRPRGVKDHLSDGQLRPQWEWAYRRGQRAFTHEEKGYLVFDRQGRPNPPQMCVSFILDAYERASGTWYLPRDQSPQRTAGGIDFNELGVKNRAGVLAFESFAKTKPDLFVASRFEERIPFAKRQAYFDYLVEHADRFEPGDVVSIQGPKPDGYVHQHAILVEDTDPVTGMPHALADQMKWPRRRTWEAIMAEAPKRALLYHVRPKHELMLRLVDRATGPTQVASAPQP